MGCYRDQSSYTSVAPSALHSALFPPELDDAQNTFLGTAHPSRLCESHTNLLPCYAARGQQ